MPFAFPIPITPYFPYLVVSKLATLSEADQCLWGNWWQKEVNLLKFMPRHRLLYINYLEIVGENVRITSRTWCPVKGSCCPSRSATAGLLVWSKVLYFTLLLGRNGSNMIELNWIYLILGYWYQEVVSLAYNMWLEQNGLATHSINTLLPLPLPVTVPVKHTVHTTTARSQRCQSSTGKITSFV